MVVTCSLAALLVAGAACGGNANDNGGEGGARQAVRNIKAEHRSE
jgi:hypothetical protein